MNALLRPRTIAVVGATAREGAVGNTVMSHAAGRRFTGSLYGIHPSHETVHGRPCVPSFADLPEPADCAVMAVGDHRIEAAMTEAAEAGVKGVVLLGRLYEEPAGDPPLKDRIAAIAREAGIAACGANCMGFFNTLDDIWLSMTALQGNDAPGKVALLSHSGSTWSGVGGSQREAGFAYGVSVGNEVATGMADYIRFMCAETEVEAIACVMETVRDPENFLAAVELADEKGVPVIVLKLGRTEKSRAFAYSHSGALSGSDAAYDAVFRRHNLIRVRTLDEMLDTLEIMTCGRAPKADGLGVQTDSGGERQLIVDLAADIGVKLAELTPATREKLTDVLDPGLEADNPVDYWGERGFEVLPQIAPILAEDAGVGLVALATNMVPNRRILFDSVAAIRAVHKNSDKPCILLGNLHSTIDRGEAARLRAEGIPVLMGTETALLAVRHFFHWHARQGRPASKPPEGPASETVARWSARLEAGAVTPEEALAMAADWGVAVPQTRSASTREAVLAAANELGYPVVLKTARADIAHKSDVGGVAVGLADEAALLAAYDAMTARLGSEVTLQQQAPEGTEIIVGAVLDPTFGPIMTVGLGGVFVEVFRDAVSFLPPVDKDEAKELLASLKGYPLLTGARGRSPADIDAVAEAVARLSVLARDTAGAIAEMDINPVIVSPDGATAVDALVITPKGREPS
jgi:acyl-CoA synthetase (NDP forming)